jgi:hypothetical protein
MLECSKMDILDFPSYPKSLNPNNTVNDRFGSLKFDDDTDNWCLFSIEVRNTYGSPFDVILERTQDGEPTASCTTTIPPGSVSRLVMPIKKALIDEALLFKPIPTLSDRQFVVAHSSLSQHEESSQRELFWYREELFKRVRGRWRETGGTRSGVLSFRSQRITLPMLEAFRMEIAHITLSLCSGHEQSEKAVPGCGGRFYPQANEFVQLTMKVTNSMPSPLVFTVDLETTPSEHVVHEGVLTDLPIGCLKSGESREITTSLCFLASGHFEILAQLRGFGASETDNRQTRSFITAVVRKE